MSLFPKTLSQIIDPLTRPALKSRGLAGTRILTDWPQIMGPALSAYTAPEKLSFPQGQKTGGTLTIAVANGFALELQHMQPVILERINTHFGYPAVARIAITQSLMKPSPSAAVPATSQSQESVAIPAIDAIDDIDVKKALQSLANSLSGK